MPEVYTTLHTLSRFGRVLFCILPCIQNGHYSNVGKFGRTCPLLQAFYLPRQTDRKQYRSIVVTARCQLYAIKAYILATVRARSGSVNVSGLEGEHLSRHPGRPFHPPPPLPNLPSCLSPDRQLDPLPLREDGRVAVGSG